MRVAFIFPGQGSQSIGMGQEIYNEFKAAGKDVDIYLGAELTE